MPLLTTGVGKYPVAAVATLKTGLQAFWEMEEASGSRADATGNGWAMGQAAGTINSTTFLAGGSGNAAAFTGTNSLASNNPNFIVDFSIVMWINFGGSLPASNANLFHCGNGKQFRIFWHTGSGDLDLSLIDDSFTFETATVTGITGTNTTYFIAGTVTAGTNGIKLSVNDGTKSTANKTVTITNIGSPFLYLGDGGVTVNVTMDQVGVWNRVLTNAEITALYNGGNGLRYSAM